MPRLTQVLRQASEPASASEPSAAEARPEPGTAPPDAMVQTLATTDLAGDAIHFCYTDAMVGGFGLTDRDFNEQPAFAGFLAGMAAAGLVVA